MITAATMSALLNPAVPVTMADSWAGLAQNSGLLRLEGDALILEFETQDGVLQVLKSGIKRFALPLRELEKCAWQPGWRGGKIELSVRSMCALEGIAGAARGCVTLKVAHKHRDLALGLVTNVELALARHLMRSGEGVESV